ILPVDAGAAITAAAAQKQIGQHRNVVQYRKPVLASRAPRRGPDDAHFLQRAQSQYTEKGADAKTEKKAHAVQQIIWLRDVQRHYQLNSRRSVMNVAMLNSSTM